MFLLCATMYQLVLPWYKRCTIVVVVVVVVVVVLTSHNQVRGHRTGSSHSGVNTIQYKGSAWVPAFAGAHASGRAGQHFDNLRCSGPIWHALNFKVMPRVEYEHGIMKVMI